MGYEIRVVRAQDLKRGDYLIGSRRTVKTVFPPMRDKVSVILENEAKVRVWNRATTIKIERKRA